MEEEENLPLVLIVEDNQDVSFYLKSILSSKYHTISAKDGEEGINLAIEEVPDIIISDVMMPEKDGFELTETLKKDIRTSHIPIILLTAKADTDSKLEGLEYGADAYLTKPFNELELNIRLAKLIQLRKQLKIRYSEFINSHNQEESKLEHSKEAQFLKKARLTIEENLQNTQFDVLHFCKAMAISRTQLHNKLKALTGCSTTQFIRKIRLQKAQQLLKTTNLNISEVAYEVGFSDPNYFSRRFSEEFGSSPSEHKNA